MSALGGFGDFLKLGEYALELSKRIRNLCSDHKHLKAKAGALSLVFGELHRALLRFDKIPEKHEEIFSDVRESCYLQMCLIEPILDKMQKIQDSSHFTKVPRKVVFAVRYSGDDLKRELGDQLVELSVMVLHLNQTADNVRRQEEHRLVVQLLGDLTTELSRFRQAILGPQRPPFPVETMRQATIELQRHAPAELCPEIKATFAEYMYVQKCPQVNVVKGNLAITIIG